MIHQAFFWLKTPGANADRAALIEGVRTLAAIEQVRSLQIGVPAPTERRDVVDASWDVAEIIEFDTVEDQRRYQTDPIHLAFIARYSPLWGRVLVYDVDVAAPAPGAP